MNELNLTHIKEINDDLNCINDLTSIPLLKKFRRGDIYYMDLTPSNTGKDQILKNRLCVIYSADNYNFDEVSLTSAMLVKVIPIKTIHNDASWNDSHYVLLPINTSFGSNCNEDYALCINQARPISVSSIGRYYGTFSNAVMDAIDVKIAEYDGSSLLKKVASIDSDYSRIKLVIDENSILKNKLHDAYKELEDLRKKYAAITDKSQSVITEVDEKPKVVKLNKQSKKEYFRTPAVEYVRRLSFTQCKEIVDLYPENSYKEIGKCYNFPDCKYGPSYIFHMVEMKLKRVDD